MDETIKVKTNTKNKFDKLKLDLKIKEGIRRTQDELVNMLMDFFKDNYKGERIKKIQ